MICSNFISVSKPGLMQMKVKNYRRIDLDHGGATTDGTIKEGKYERDTGNNTKT